MRNNFIMRKNNGIHYYIIPSFENTGLVKHMFTTRIGGTSTSSFSSLNLGKNSGDEEVNIKENFERTAGLLNISLENIVLSDQVHSTNIRVITKEDRGKGLVKEMDYFGIDGLLTNVPNIALFTFFADCVPLFFLDKNKKVVGVAHAGWRGTVNKIAGKMVDKMVEIYGSHSQDILVGIGPSIGACCYEVGMEVYDKFDNNFTNIDKLLIPKNGEKWTLDLWMANKYILKEKGILDKNITVSELCTSCNNDLFFSYRKENGKTGRMAAIIALK